MSKFKKIRNYLPYWLLGILKHKQSTQVLIDFYCDNITDYICFKKVLAHYPQIRVIAKNKKLQAELRDYQIEALVYPSYPDLVIMCRHSTWRYPLKRIKKIGMRHGPYHFKDFIKADNYNEFDSYFFTSPTEVKEAKELGITNGVGVGFPKLDDAFDGTIGPMCLKQLREKLKLKSQRTTIIFSATWSKSNYSAINKWYDKLDKIADDYNILVTVHEWTPNNIKNYLKHNQKILYIEDKDILPYLMIADIMVGDISSKIAEFIALNKPVFTSKIPVGGRISPEIVEMLDEITYRVDSFEEMQTALKEIVKSDDIHQEKRKYYNKKMFGELDGKAHIRAKEEIDRFISKL